MAGVFTPCVQTMHFRRHTTKGSTTDPEGETEEMTTDRDATKIAAPLTGQRAHEIQAFGTVVPMPIALAEETRRGSVDNLNQLLADTITLRDLYKKHHWQVSGPTF